MQLKNSDSFALMKKIIQLAHWNQLPLTLKIFVVLTFLSVIQYVWNLSFSRGYVAGIQPFAIKNNLALNYFFILFNLCLSIIFIYAVFKKNKQIFLYYIYWGLIYPPIGLLFTWLNSGKPQSTGMFYLFFMVPSVILIFWVLYRQRHYFDK